MACHLRIKFEKAHHYCTSTTTRKTGIHDNCNGNSSYLMIISNCHRHDHSLLVSVESLVTDVDLEQILTRGESTICLAINIYYYGQQKTEELKSKEILQYLVHSHSPILLVYSYDNETLSFPDIVPYTSNATTHNNMTKRQANPLKKSRSKQCRMIRHYIDFKRIGFNKNKFVVPSGYYANYCHGHCLFPLRRGKMTLHAQVQSLAAQLRGDIPPPCCSAVRHRSLVMLTYSASRNLVLRRRKNMVVSRCGCI